MACLKEVVKNCILLAANLMRVDPSAYINVLSDQDETNYILFYSFMLKCPSAMLAILFRLGHFAGQSKLIEIVGAIVAKRQVDPWQYEEDYGGHIANFLVHFRRNPLTGEL